MDILTPTSSSRSDGLDALERDVRTLRLAVQIIVVSLVILSGSLGVYLFRQVSLLRRQVIASDRMARQMAHQFNVNMATQAASIERQLLAFARTNPAFHAQIAKLYVGTGSPPVQLNPSPLSPAAPNSLPQPPPE
jgi:hypothetical protein